MISLLISIKKVCSSFITIFKREDTKALFFLIATTLLSGTIFYWTMEGMEPIDALYLSFMTLTTIGYGDVYPITALGKVFTMLYAAVGVGLMGMFISVIAKAYIYSKESKHSSKYKSK